MVSGGSNPTADDVVCKACPDGMYMPNSEHQLRRCGVKTDYQCAAGQYLDKGLNSPTSDDWMCKACLDGMYMTSSTHKFVVCAPKTQCIPGQYLQISAGNSKTENDYLCRACEKGTYGDAAGTHQDVDACKDKTAATCTPGEYYFQGTSNTADDWGCKDCEPGTYMPTGAGSHQNSDCAFKRVQNCNVGEFYSKGTSKVIDDWGCKPCGPGSFMDSLIHATTTCRSKLLACKLGETLDDSGDDKVVNDWKCVPKPPRTVALENLVCDDHTYLEADGCSADGTSVETEFFNAFLSHSGIDQRPFKCFYDGTNAWSAWSVTTHSFTSSSTLMGVTVTPSSVTGPTHQCPLEMVCLFLFLVSMMLLTLLTLPHYYF